MKIYNASVYRDGKFEKGGFEFNEKFEGFFGEGCSFFNDPAAIDARGAYVIPGLIDIHTHGALGMDVTAGEPGCLDKLSRYYAAKGVTSWCPTTLTAKEETLKTALNEIRDFKSSTGCAKIAGVNLEGPFLSEGRSGAMNVSELCKPDIDMFRRLNEASGGKVRLITVAPDVPGALEFIKEAKNEVTVSIGHTTASYEDCLRAIDAGASHMTHLYNCMEGIHHRKPGAVPAALEGGVTVELITDGFHIHPAVIRLTHTLFGEKLCLISDSIRCAGLSDGEYDMAGMAFTVTDGKATLKGRDTIAGSSIHLMDGLKRAVSFGIPLEKAVYAATEVPASVIGAAGETGSISTGKWADFVILDKELNVVSVYINGKKYVEEP